MAKGKETKKPASKDAKKSPKDSKNNKGKKK